MQIVKSKKDYLLYLASASQNAEAESVLYEDDYARLTVLRSKSSDKRSALYYRFSPKSSGKTTFDHTGIVHVVKATTDGRKVLAKELTNNVLLASVPCGNRTAYVLGMFSLYPEI